MIKSRIYNKNCIAPCFDNSLLHAPLFSQKQMKNIKRFFVGAFAVLILLAFITPVIAYAGIKDEINQVDLKNNIIPQTDIELEYFYNVYPSTGWTKIEYNDYKDYKIEGTYNLEFRIYELKEKVQLNENALKFLEASKRQYKDMAKTLIEIKSWDDVNRKKRITNDTDSIEGYIIDFEEFYKVAPEQYGRMIANANFGYNRVTNFLNFMDDVMLIPSSKDVEDQNAGGDWFVSRRFWQVANNLYNVVSSIGILLVAVYLVLYIIQTASETGGFTPEKWLSLGIKFVLVIVLISWGPQIISFIMQLGNTMLKAVGDPNEGYEHERIAQIRDAFTNVIYNPAGKVLGIDLSGPLGFFQGISDGLGSIFSKGFTILGMLLVQIVGLTTLISRTLKFAIYYSMAPIALADSWNGVNSHSIKYLKQMFSFFLQGLVVIAALMLFVAVSSTNAFQNGETTAALSPQLKIQTEQSIAPIKSLLLGIGCASVMLSSKKISDSIIGA